MKRSLTLSILLVCLILSTADGYAGGPWGIRFRGGGQLTFNNAVGGQPTDAHITWNFKLSKAPTPEINGHLNLTERLSDGSRRNFRLSGEQIETGGDPLNGETYFHCDSGDREVQLMGSISESETITVTFKELENTVFYKVTDVFSSNPALTETEGFLQLNGHMVLDCAEESQVGQQGRTADPSKIFLPIVLSEFGN
ncbi:MAG: hypothetical protein P8Y03_28320 [Anaerolineales bacterium]